MTVEWVERDHLMDTAAEHIKPVATVLDIGCGIRPQAFVQPRLQVLCDPFVEYVAVLKETFQDRHDTIVLQATALPLLANLPDRCVDSIFLIDVIEHLPKEDGRRVLAACERVAREQVVLFTPLGYMHQDYAAGDQDAWGYRGGAWQAHRSGWTPDDFDTAWDIYACERFHLINGKGEPFDPPFGAFWAILNVGDSAAAPESAPAELSMLDDPLISHIRTLEQRGSPPDETIRVILDPFHAYEQSVPPAKKSRLILTHLKQRLRMILARRR